MRTLYALLIALILVLPNIARADCSSPASPAGAMIYNIDYTIMQYCNGTDWIAVPGVGLDCPVSDTIVMSSSGWSCSSYSGGCNAPTLCPNIGDVCDDGNAGTTNDPLFAGFIAYNDSGTCEALYVTNNNQSAASQWKTSTGTDDITNDAIEDGQINDGQIPDSATFPAFKLCKDLGDGGFTDWYMPARGELDLLWRNRAAIDANAAGTFTGSNYWSSTEASTGNTWNEVFSVGSLGTNPKTNTYDVRCVRRD